MKWGTTFFDIDNDSWPDLITVSGHVYPQVDSLPSGARYREPAILSINQRDGTFCDAGKQPAGPCNQEIAFFEDLPWAISSTMETST